MRWPKATRAAGLRVERPWMRHSSVGKPMVLFRFWSFCPRGQCAGTRGDPLVHCGNYTGFIETVASAGRQALRSTGSEAAPVSLAKLVDVVAVSRRAKPSSPFDRPITVRRRDTLDRQQGVARTQLQNVRGSGVRCYGGELLSRP